MRRMQSTLSKAAGFRGAELTLTVNMQVGEVKKREADRVLVATAEGMVSAQAAVSCLVRPECGDRVMLASHGAERYVLAVLERAAEAPSVLCFPHGVEVQVYGDLSLSATGRAAMQGEAEVRLCGDRVEVSGTAVAITGQKVSIVGEICQWLADNLESTARLIKQVADSWSTHSRIHQRQVDDIELVRAGNVDMRVEHVVNVGATHTIVKSRELTKLDGKLIQVG